MGLRNNLLALCALQRTAGTGLPVHHEGTMNSRRGHIWCAVFLAVALFWGHQSAYAQESQKKIPVTVTADKLDYNRAKDEYVAKGNVKVEQHDLKIEADDLILNNKTGEAHARGNVHLQDRKDVLKAEKLDFNVYTRAGIIYNGELFIKDGNYHMKGERIEKLSEGNYRVRHGIFTTCDEGEWYLQAREINVDMNRYATARGVSFNMKGLPLIYTPYLLFPVRRQTGLLLPEAGYSSSDGFLMKNAFFWAISDHKDMTLYSDYRDNVGHGTGVEYRYVNSRESSGEIFYNYFAETNSTGTRWEFKLKHHEEFAEDLSARVDINLVDDENYYQTLEKKLEIRSRPYLDSNAFYVERWDTAALYLAGQYSIDLTNTNEKTIQKLPELRYSIFEERLAGPIHLGFEGSAVNFSVQDEDGLRRAAFRPSLTAAFASRGLSFTPRAGIDAAYYDRGTTSVEPVERLYYFAGADLNARFSRVFGKDEGRGIGKIRHSIEPSISYEFVPSVQSGEIPQFDSLDVVERKNLVTVSLINRLTAHYRDDHGFKTFDMMVLRLSQSYDLLTGAAQERSELKGALYVKAPKLFTLSATADYDTDRDRRTTSSVSVTVEGAVMQFDVSHRYLRETNTKYLVGGAGLTLSRWKLSGQVWQDLETQQTTQEEYKAQYNSQCWGLGISYISRPGETRYMAMLELKGLGAAKF